MIEKKKPDVITPQELYQSRRKFLKTSLTYSSAAALLAACQPIAPTPTPQTGTSSALSDELEISLPPKKISPDLPTTTNFPPARNNLPNWQQILSLNHGLFRSADW